MTLTNENYYSLEANREYMSVSQFKQFCKCEAAAMAEIRGEWHRPDTPALLVGSYVDSYFEGTLPEFIVQHPQIFKKDGTLKAEFQIAETVIERVSQDALFMCYMSGEKQVIVTGELFGTPWKIKMDSYHPGKMIVDLKVMRTMDRIMGKSFVEHWGYDLQLMVYRAIEGHDLETYLAVATKQTPVNLDVIHVPTWRHEELYKDTEKRMTRIASVKKGLIEPKRCGVCEYCRATKKLRKPIDFELVGLSSQEIDAVFGYA